MTERLVDFIKTVFETGKERIKNTPNVVFNFWGAVQLGAVL
jgi:hypothetical protein